MIASAESGEGSGDRRSGGVGGEKREISKVLRLYRRR